LDEYANKLTTFMLIAQNDGVHVPTNMVIFKSPEYACLWICNIDNTKVIDWIFIYSKL